VTQIFSPDWTAWIKTNTDAGVKQDVIFKILLEHGFDHADIQQKIGFTPNVPLGKPLQIHLSNAANLSTDLAEFYVLDDFLNHEECQELFKITQSSMVPSQVNDQNSVDLSSSFRTSMTSHLSTLDNNFVKSINSRICNTIGINDSYSEGIQGQYYTVGQEFKPHHDYFGDKLYHLPTKTQGERTYTFMVYLNDVEEGGETEFSLLNIKIKPQLGRAIIWNNLHSNGNPNINTMHQSHPVIKGTKCIITKWFRSIDRQTINGRMLDCHNQL